jgi:heme/copper-type cytochrome/quinol oxidase subunit 1
MVVMTASPAPAPRPARTVRVVLVSLVVLGVALLGAAAWVESLSQPPGWFAYAPLSDTVYAPAEARWLGTEALLSGAGALLIGGVAGFVVGRRGQRPPSRSADF